MKERKMDVKKRIHLNTAYDDHYEEFFEYPDIAFSLMEFKGKDREKFIELEEKQNPIHFKKFREENPEFFE